MNDLFGSMTYDHYWKARTTIPFWKEQREITFGIKTKEWSMPKYEDKAAAQRIFDHMNQYEKICLEETKRYMEEMPGKGHGTDHPALKSIILFRDGRTVFFFNCEWDREHGFAIQVEPEILCGTEDMFL